MRLTRSILLGLLAGIAFTLLGLAGTWAEGKLSVKTPLFYQVHNGLSVIVGIAVGIGAAFAAYENDI